MQYSTIRQASIYSVERIFNLKLLFEERLERHSLNFSSSLLILLQNCINCNTTSSIHVCSIENYITRSIRPLFHRSKFIKIRVCNLYSLLYFAIWIIT